MKIYILLLMIAILYLPIVFGSELSVTRSRTDNLESDYDRILAETKKTGDFDSKLYQRAISLDEDSNQYKGQSKILEERGEVLEALTNSQLSLFYQYYAFYTIYLSRVTYYRNKTLEFNSSYKESWYPAFDLTEKLSNTEGDYNRVFNYWKSLGRYSDNNVTIISTRVTDRDGLDLLLLQTFSDYKSLKEDFEERVIINKDLDGNTKIQKFLIFIIALVSAIVVFDFYSRFKTVKFKGGITYADLKEEVELPRHINGRLEETVRVIKAWNPTASALMIGATLEAFLAHLYRIEMKKEPDKRMTLFPLITFITRHFVTDSYLEKEMMKIQDMRIKAAHYTSFKFDQEEIKYAFNRLKDIIRAYLTTPIRSR